MLIAIPVSVSWIFVPLLIQPTNPSPPETSKPAYKGPEFENPKILFGTSTEDDVIPLSLSVEFTDPLPGVNCTVCL